MDDNHADSIKANGELCFNGHYNTQYELPLYNYLTNAKWKQPLKTILLIRPVVNPRYYDFPSLKAGGIKVTAVMFVG